MADIAPQGFVNFGLSQAQQGLAEAQTGQTAAEAQLTQQKVQQAQMATELQQRAMPMYRQAIDDMMADQSGANARAPTNEQPRANVSGVNQNGQPQLSHYADNGAIAEELRQQNFVQPVTPQEARRLQQGSIMAAMPGGNPAFFEQAKLQRDLRVQQQTAAKQYRSGQMYDTLTAVASPDNQHPFQTLQAINDPHAQQIMAEHPGDDATSEAQRDAAARQYANVAAFHVHQYTDHKTEMQNGTLVDTTIGQKVTGQEQVLTGLTPEQRDKVVEYWTQPIPVKFTDGTEQPMARYLAPKDQGGGGGVSLDALLRREDALARANLSKPGAPSPGAGTWDHPSAPGNTGAQPAPAAGPPPKAGAKPATGTALAQQRGVPSKAPAAYDFSQPAAPAGTPQYNQRVNAALADASYKDPYNPDTMPHTPGAPKPGVQGKITQYLKNREDAQTEFSEHAQAASQSLMNFRAAQAILSEDPSRFMSGPIGAMLQKLANAGLIQTDTAEHRMEAAKYLTNAAVAGLKTTYGARPGVFDVKINVEKAFPNIESQDLPTTRRLVDSQIKQMEYLRDSAGRGAAFINQGYSPTRFNEWNEKYFPRSDILAKPKAEPSQMETQAKSAWGAYEPDKYEYRTNGGKLQRRALQ